ncbi:MAG: PAS domain S-box protein [Elainellaceae cyanobacterium]
MVAESSSNGGTSDFDASVLVQDDACKTREQLVEELQTIRQKMSELEASQRFHYQTQASLLFTIQRYRDILENAVAGFFQTTPDGQYILANRAIATMLGYESSSEMMSAITDLKAQVYANPDDRDRFMATLAEHGRVQGFEYQACGKDGRVIWVSEDARAVIDCDGEILYYEGSSVDVTKRKEAEAAVHDAKRDLEERIEERTAALRESNDYLISEIAKRKRMENDLLKNQELLHAIIDAVPATINAKDLDARYILMNTYQGELYQIAPEEAVGKTIGELLGETYAELNDPYDQQVIQTGEPVPFFEQDYEDLDGDRRTWLKTKVPLRSPKGELYGVATVAVDITNRRQAEQALSDTQDQLHAILETVPGIVSWISRDLRYLGVNRHLASMFGLSPEDFTNRDIGFLNASSEFNDFVADFFTKPEQESFQEFRASVNGNPRWYLIVVQKYNNGQAAFAVGIDVTERRQAEDALRMAKDQLQAALDAVPGIVSWISSDLRYLGVNRHLAALFNIPPDAFVGQDIGFLHTSPDFNNFVEDLFASPNHDASQEISAYVNGTVSNFLIMAQKYDEERAVFTVGIDITKQKQAQLALTEAESRYRSIFESVAEGIFQTTPSGQYISANPALARIYGYASPEELMLSLTSIQNQLYVKPQRRQEFVKILRENGAVVDFESQVYRKDGRLIWISENARIVENDQTGDLYFEGTVEDITERKIAVEALKRAKAELESKVDERTKTLKDLNERLVTEIMGRRQIENALRTSEAELRALFAAMTDYIAVFDAQGRYCKIVSTNSNLLYDPDTERIGKTVYDVLPPEKAAMFVIQIQRALNTGQTINLEYCLPFGDEPGVLPSQDREAWYIASVSPMPNNCVIWVARDITESKRAESALRKAEEKYRSIFENAVEGIFQVSPDGAIISVNPALVQMYGYSSPQELMDGVGSVSSLYVDPDRYQEFTRILETQDFVSNFESQVRRRDGNIIWTEESARAVRDTQGVTQYFEGTVQDITVRKQAEIALKAEQDKSERLLLNILPQAIAEQLKQNPQSIAKRFDEATILFADIVDFTTVSTNISPTDLVDLLNRIFSSFDKLAEKHGLEKIKTIGDAYMVAGGLPTLQDNHAQAIANMALDMQQTIAQFQRDDQNPFQLRIGINTGPVVAGVIGIRKFIYDLWGDTVNVASRMEARGLPGKIQVTEEVYSRLCDSHQLEKRGEVEVKGKGMMTTYWLLGRH